MALRDLSLTGEEDVTGFFFKFELVEMSGKSDEEKAMYLVRYLDEDALGFYLEVFTEGSRITAEGKVWNTVKYEMVSRYIKEKADAEIIQ